MNKLSVFLAILLFCNCSVNKSQYISGIQIYLKNKKVFESSTLEVIITNKSKENYYLFLNTSSLQDFLRFFNVDGNLCTLTDGIEDRHGNNVNLVLTSDDVGEYKLHRLEDIFTINAGEEKNLSIPFNMKSCLSQDYCIYYDTDMMDSKKKYYIYVQYRADKEYIKNALQKNIKDSLELMGYKMFDKTIKSNRVELDYKIE